MSMYPSDSTLQSPAQQQSIPASPLLSQLPARARPGTPSSETLSTLDVKHRVQAKVQLPSALLPLAQSTRSNFARALAADQEAVLRPDYRTSFRNVNDVVKRLLPYHVWNINEDDLRWAMQGQKDEANESSSTSVLQFRKRKRGVSEQDSVAESFPSSDESKRLFARHSNLSTCVRKLRYELTGGTSGSSEGSLFYQESLYNIERLAVEHERELLSVENEELRQAKELAMSTGVPWDELMRINSAFPLTTSTQTTTPSAAAGLVSGQAVNGYSPIAFQKSVGSLPSTSAAAATPGRIGQTKGGSGPMTPKGIADSLPTTPQGGLSKGSKPRGRPRKTRDQNGRIIATPPLIRPSEVPAKQKPDTTSSIASSSFSSSSSSAKKKVTPPNIAAATPTPAPPLSSSASRPPLPRPPPPTSSSPSPLPATSPAPIIPSHPIPLVLPLSTLSRLSSLGIAPVPAPHLLPVISAQQAQRHSENRNGSSTPPVIPLPATVHSTAPRPAPTNQQEPALLMGITEAPSTFKADGGQGKSSNSTQQMLHVSVVLSKLSPSQLSGLANLMQSLQNPSPSTTTSKPSTTAAAAAPTTTSANRKHSSGADSGG